MYSNSTPPSKVEQLPTFLETELAQIAEAINQVTKYSGPQLSAKDSDANRRNKAEGRPVWDTTSKKPVWPTGNSPESVWIFGDGSIAYSPI